MFIARRMSCTLQREDIASITAQLDTKGIANPKPIEDDFIPEIEDDDIPT